MRDRRTTMGWISRRETVIGSAGLALAFLLLAGISILLFRQAGSAWTAAHGHGTHGTWTATRRDQASKGAAWYGDFAPDGSGPIRHNVPLMSNAAAIHLGQSIPAVDGGPGGAFAASDTWRWLPSAIFATVFAALAGLLAWLVIHHLRGPRRHQPLNAA